VEVHPDEQGATTAAFLALATGLRGVRIDAVMTDNARAYTHSR